MQETQDPSYILHHLGEDGLPLNAVSPPIFQTSIFCFESFDAFRDALSSEEDHYLYTRGNNPTVNLAEQKLAALEKAEKAKLVSAGVSAISAAIMGFVRSGDHVVCIKDCYSWTKSLLDSYLARFGVEHTFVDGVTAADFEAAIRPNTKIIYLESPTTLTFKLQDIEAIALMAHSRGIKVAIDSTWATPIFMNPIELGVDLVVHSASKYIGGHSDLVAGVIAGSAADVDHIFSTEFQQLGTVPDPMMAWLVLRGLRTLAVRMPVHFANALHIAQLLEGHPAVESVLYPFLPSHPQYALARQQMRGGSGLFSFRLKTRDIASVRTFVDSLKMFKRAVSWGGYESLVYPDAAHYPGDPPEDRVSLIRFHIGLEDREALAVDVQRALSTIS